MIYPGEFGWYLFWGYVIVINLYGFILMGIDKNKARKNRWRIPERTLLSVAILGGGLGSYAGMRTFRHKTKHKKIVFVLSISALFYLLLFGYIFLKGYYGLSH